MAGHDLSVQRFQELKRDWPGLYQKVFHEEGFIDVVPVMISCLTKVRDMWADIYEKVLKEE